MIPIIVVWGHRTSLYKMGWTARLCTRCRKVQPFECFDQAKASHVYYIYGKEKSVGRILTCDFCESSIGLTMKGAKSLVIDTHWNGKKALQELVDSTNDQLGRVATSAKPSREELFALLESVDERSSPYKIDAGGGFAKGAIVGAPALAIVGLLLNLVGVLGLDILGSLMLGSMTGALIGGTIGAVKFKFDRAKELAQEILISSMERKSLSLEMLQRALKHHPRSLRYASAGLNELANLS